MFCVFGFFSSPKLCLNSVLKNAFQHIFNTDRQTAELARVGVCVWVCVCVLRSELLLSLEKWHWKPVVFSAFYANTLSCTEWYVLEHKSSGSQGVCGGLFLAHPDARRLVWAICISESFLWEDVAFSW